MWMTNESDIPIIGVPEKDNRKNGRKIVKDIKEENLD